jgi:hypothetical protein
MSIPTVSTHGLIAAEPLTELTRRYEETFGAKLTEQFSSHEREMEFRPTMSSTPHPVMIPESSTTNMISLRGIDVDMLPLDELLKLKLNLRNRISDRVFERATKLGISRDESQAAGNWIAVHSRERSLERIIERNKGSFDPNLSLDCSNAALTNLSIVKLCQMRLNDLPDNDDLGEVDRKALLEVARLFKGSKESYEDLQIDDEIFEKDLIEEVSCLDVRALVERYHLPVLGREEGTTQKRFI